MNLLCKIGLHDYKIHREELETKLCRFPKGAMIVDFKLCNRCLKTKLVFMCNYRSEFPDKHA